MNNSCKSKLARPCVRRSICAPWIVLLLLVLALPAAVQAQFTYVTNNGSITITDTPALAGRRPSPIQSMACRSPASELRLLPVLDPDQHYDPQQRHQHRGLWFYNCNGLTSVAIPTASPASGSMRSLSARA